MTVADQPGVVSTCTGGTVLADAGGNTIEYSDGLVAAGASCTISVRVMAEPGDYVNISGDLSSSSGLSIGDSAGAGIRVLNIVDIPTLSTLGLLITILLFGGSMPWLMRRNGRLQLIKPGR